MEWFHKKYWADGENGRYKTFNQALKLFKERHPEGTIIETGCQRQKNDLGAGMSTSIFAEYISKYGGKLFVCDNDPRHLQIAMHCVKEWSETAEMTFVLKDSVEFLANWQESIGLLYLDSYDYPIVEIVNSIDDNWDRGYAKIEEMAKSGKLFEEWGHVLRPCQEHCLKEFTAIEERLSDDVILLIDDAHLPGGGKPGTLNPYLADKGWKCLDSGQQTLWIKE